MSQEREWVITLKTGEDLDRFYDDMESRYGSDSVPSRLVECAYRRPMSRSTHYYLTDAEAEIVATDPRIEAIELTFKEMGHEIKPTLFQTSSNFDKSGTNNANDVNWALYRSTYGATKPAGWGSDSTPVASGTIELTNAGLNVDVVIIDGHMVPNHPEWAVNQDGTGGSRLNQFNWFQYNNEVRGVAAGTYVYDFLTDASSIANNNHGNNVGAIVAGSSCGWAKLANIYNISPYSGSTANATGYGNYTYDLFNYIRVWHNNKPINPATGRKNPTVCNMSFGFNGGYVLNDITKIYYQGVEYTKPAAGWAVQDRINFDLVAASGTTMLFMVRNASIDADIADCISDGIILVGAAGNFYMYNDRSGGINYDNYLRQLLSFSNYMRGPSPGAADGVICVSAIDSTLTEQKVNFSNAGPRTDIFAPGTNIMGAHYSGGVADPRNSSFVKGKMSGTSQASPQVCGLVACALETYPNMKPTEALAYIQTYAYSEIMSGGGAFSTAYGAAEYLSYNKLYGGPNKYAAYRKERLSTGNVFPKKNFKFRPSDGAVYPRPRIRRYG